MCYHAEFGRSKSRGMSDPPEQFDASRLAFQGYSRSRAELVWSTRRQLPPLVFLQTTKLTRIMIANSHLQSPGFHRSHYVCNTGLQPAYLLAELCINIAYSLFNKTFCTARGSQAFYTSWNTAYLWPDTLSIYLHSTAAASVPVSWFLLLRTIL